MHPRSSRGRYLCVKNATKYLEGNIYTMREIIRSRDSGILFRLFSFNMIVIFEKYMTFFVNLKVMFRLYGHFLTSLGGYSTYHYNSSNGINSWETWYERVRSANRPIAINCYFHITSFEIEGYKAAQTLHAGKWRKKGRKMSNLSFALPDEYSKLLLIWIIIDYGQAKTSFRYCPVKPVHTAKSLISPL